MGTGSCNSEFASILLVSLYSDTIARSSGTVNDTLSTGSVTLTTGNGVGIGVSGG